MMKSRWTKYLRICTKQIFSDVSVSFKNDKLIIKVIENPIIEDLDITGVSNKEFKEKLLSALNLKTDPHLTKIYLRVIYWCWKIF